MLTDLVDIGANLTDRAFSRDRECVLRQARQAGVAQILVTGTSITSTKAAIGLAQQYPGQLYATAGVHPHHASQWNDSSASELKSAAQHPVVIAIGETGLDFNRTFSPQADQRRAFDAQLALATEMDMPVFIHVRDALEDALRMISSYRNGLPGAVVHCFTGNRVELDACLALDLHIGITGWVCDERRGTQLRQAVAHIPLDRLLLETDSPYLLPRDLRPKPPRGRNVPATLPHIVASVASLMNLDPQIVATATSCNARRLFRLPKQTQTP